MIGERRPEWQKKAACLGKWEEIQHLFFPEVEAEWAYKEGKAICAGCPVRSECLETNREEPWGLFGGLTPLEREQLREKAS